MKCRCGGRISAFNAVNAALSVRTALSAPNITMSPGWRARRKRFKSAPVNARGYPDVRFTLQFYVEDCTGCGLCIEACPAHSPSILASRPSTWSRKRRWCNAERANIAFFEHFRSTIARAWISPMCAASSFWSRCSSFPGACAGCGETPYLKLLSQLFGDRMMVANATGCSSIYGGNLPVTPGARTRKAAGRPGPIRCSRTTPSLGLASGWPPTSICDLATAPAQSLSASWARAGRRHPDAPQIQESEIRAQRLVIAELKTKLLALAERNDARA